MPAGRAGSGLFLSIRKHKMAKITLGTTPKTFKRFPVKFKLPDGEEGIINVTFKYKTRSGYGEYLNAMFKASGEEAPASNADVDFVALYKKTGAKSAEKLVEAIDSWDFEYPLTAETLAQLHDEIPSALAALAGALQGACTEGRLGN